MKAAVPINETQRLQALRRYAILDTVPEAAFDRITSLAARLLNMPVVMVTLIDKDRQWFKSCYGFTATDIPREDTFCSHAILSDKITIVPDATLDPRFLDNPLVTGGPRVRFYAGAPLKSIDGFNLGTLCAVDFRPREFGEEQEGVLRDFAALVADELHLRLAVREKIQQATAIENLSSGVSVSDPNQPDNPIIFCNSGFVAMTGYTAEEAVGRNCRFLQGPLTDPGTLQEIRNAIAEKRDFHCELVNYRKNGEIFWNELRISPVFDKDGQLISFIGLQNDVTERKRTENALKESYDQLRELETQRDDLTNMIVHDLRSPLNAILMSVTLLKARSSAAEEGDRKLLNLAQGSAEKLIEMVSQLLDVSRLESGEMMLTTADWDLVTLSEESVKILAPQIGKRGLEIEANGPVIARCDGQIVQRIIGNLVGNALKFTPDGGFVKIRIESDRSRAIISVSDDGPGVAPEFQERIFEKFCQVKASVSRVGTGLGLTFCKLAAEAHGGSVSLKSEMGRGSTFSFELPLNTGAVKSCGRPEPAALSAT